MTSGESHLYRPASPMISAMAPQHGSPPLAYSKPLHSTLEDPAVNFGAGHPSFQAQHHRPQQYQPLLPQQPQQQHSMALHADYQAPSESYSGELNYENMSTYTRNNNNNYNPCQLESTPAPSAASAQQQPPPQQQQQPVIADLDQLQQQQRQQQQQQLSAKSLDSQPHLHPHSIHPNHIQQQHHSPLESANPAPEQQRQMNLIHPEVDPHVLEMNQLTELGPNSPLDGNSLPPLMDGESPPGSDMHDSPLYPWMRSQFGKYIHSTTKLTHPIIFSKKSIFQRPDDVIEPRSA